MEIVIKRKIIPVQGFSGEEPPGVKGMVAILYENVMSTWESEFFMKLNSNEIQKVVNRYTARIVMKAAAGKATAEMLDIFMSRYELLQQAISNDAPRGSGLAQAWHAMDDAGQPIVQAIVLINPYQADAFEKHAFGETAQELDLDVSYFDEAAESGPMDRWIDAATSILQYSSGPINEDTPRALRTKSTLFLGNGRKVRGNTERGPIEAVAA